MAEEQRLEVTRILNASTQSIESMNRNLMKLITEIGTIITAVSEKYMQEGVVKKEEEKIDNESVQNSGSQSKDTVTSSSTSSTDQESSGAEMKTQKQVNKQKQTSSLQEGEDNEAVAHQTNVQEQKGSSDEGPVIDTQELINGLPEKAINEIAEIINGKLESLKQVANTLLQEPIVDASSSGESERQRETAIQQRETAIARFRDLVERLRDMIQGIPGVDLGFLDLLQPVLREPEVTGKAHSDPLPSKSSKQTKTARQLPNQDQPKNNKFLTRVRDFLRGKFFREGEKTKKEDDERLPTLDRH